MPRTWHDRHSINDIEDEETRYFYRSIVADKKPYFMRYIYPDLMKQYNTFITNTGKNAQREFQMTVQDMAKIPYDQLTDRQKDFLRRFDDLVPVGAGNCVMNKICRLIEDKFDGYVKKSAESDFDYTIMKSDAEYTTTQYNALRKIYDDYNQRLRNYKIFALYERVGTDEKLSTMMDMRSQFIRECSEICPNEESLCNALLDICYKRNKTKQFVWDVCGQQIIRNLLNKNENKISYPELCEYGDITYCGKKFATKTITIGENNEYSAE